MHLGLGRIFRTAASSACLHLQETVAERVGAEAEVRARKTVAVPKTIFHFALHGAVQYRTNTAHEPQLRGQLSGSLFRKTGAAGAAAAIDK